jgi:hypothetical protein
MARKFRRTRRKRGRGSGPEIDQKEKKKCQENKNIIDKLKEYQTKYNNVIEQAIPDFENISDKKKELDDIKKSIKNYEETHTLRGTEEYKTLLTRKSDKIEEIDELTEKVDKRLEYGDVGFGDIIELFKEGKDFKGHEVKDYFIKKYNKKIKDYEIDFQNKNCNNLLNGGKKSRRKRRKSKKRKTRRRKKRTRRRKRKKR